MSSRELDISNIEREVEVMVFSSNLGVGIVSGVVRQQVETKLGLAQQLLVLQQITLAASNLTGLSAGTLDLIQSTFLPRTTVMVHCYSVLAWLSLAPLTAPSQAVVQQGARQLAVLEVTSECEDSGDHHNLLELLLASSAGSRVRTVVGPVTTGDIDMLARRESGEETPTWRWWS